MNGRFVVTGSVELSRSSTTVPSTKAMLAGDAGSELCAKATACN